MSYCYCTWYLGAWIWCQTPREAIALARLIASEWRKPPVAIAPDLARWSDDGGAP